MWARGVGRGGGRGGRSLAQEALEQNQRERVSREGPQRPLSERHDQWMRDGQEIAAALAERLPPGTREALSGPRPVGADDDEAVQTRCRALLEMNRESLRERGDAPGSDEAFLARCRNLPRRTLDCAERGEEGRSDPECRPHLAVLDREVRTLRGEARSVEHPDQRIDSLVAEPWEAERGRAAPDRLAPETVD